MKSITATKEGFRVRHYNNHLPSWRPIKKSLVSSEEALRAKEAEIPARTVLKDALLRRRQDEIASPNRRISSLSDIHSFNYDLTREESLSLDDIQKIIQVDPIPFNLLSSGKES